jgi:SAM-dependent methyltransferase
MKARVDYDQIAPTYDRRFVPGQSSGEADALWALASGLSAGRALEVGCGTGHWLAELAPLVSQLYGLDFSAGMLRQAQNHPVRLALTRGTAELPPFQASCFDLVYCVNAIHHFPDPAGFVSEAYRLLMPGGALAVIGMGPPGRRNSWYVYDYFDGTYEADLERFPSYETMATWMISAGFEDVRLSEVRHISDPKPGRWVLDDPFLQKKSTSQLALLSDEAYAAGLRKIKAALARAEAAGETLVFHSELILGMVAGYKERGK